MRGRDQPTDQGSTDQPTEQGELVAELREQVAYFRDQLRREQDAHAEASRLLAGALERIPGIEAPAELPGEPTEATEQPGRVEPQPAVQSTQAQESPEMAMPEAGGGPLPHDQQRPSERRWWEFWR